MFFTFHSFVDISIADWLSLLNHPNVIRHMPLAEGHWNDASVTGWARGKDAQWEINGYGPRAIRIDGVFAGWGGFQKEADGADLALVLLPKFWGYGAELLRALLRRRTELNSKRPAAPSPPAQKPHAHYSFP